MGDREREFGVSVVICCYNSRNRLPATLEHLAVQKNPLAIPWEVLVVDNASTDGTGIWAQKTWPAHAQAPLRVVREAKKGLAQARIRGIQQARYALISFIDDDNWVNDQWIAALAQIFRTRPEIGICGARPFPAAEGTPPFWFNRYSHAYVASMQAEDLGDVSTRPLAVKGAGLSLRYDVWQTLSRAGFAFHTQGRNGTRLSSGEDSELVFAVAIAGYRLWNDASLAFRHFIPQERLHWDYLEKLYRGFGESSIIIDIYRHFFLQGSELKAPSYLKTLYRILISLLRLPMIRLMLQDTEGRHDRIQFAFRSGRLTSWLRLGWRYHSLYSNILHMVRRIEKQKKVATEKVKSCEKVPV